MTSSFNGLVWERLAAEASLRVHAAVVADAATGEVLHLTELAEEMFGYAGREIVGQCVDQLLPEDMRNRHVGHRQEFSKHPHARPMGHGLPLWGRKKDGDLFPVQVSLSPVKALGREVVVAFVIDLSGVVNTLSRIKSAFDSGAA